MSPSPQSWSSARSFYFWYMDVLRLASLRFFPAVVWLSQGVHKTDNSEEGKERNAELGEGKSFFSGHHLHLHRDPSGVCRGPALQSLGSVAAHRLGPSLRLSGRALITCMVIGGVSIDHTYGYWVQWPIQSHDLTLLLQPLPISHPGFQPPAILLGPRPWVLCYSRMKQAPGKEGSGEGG